MSVERLAHRWSPEEDAIVRENYRLGARAVLTLLPSRTYDAVVNRAPKLGVVKSPHWTQAEDDIIRDFFGSEQLGNLARKLPGRSREAISKRARAIGLGAAEVLQGFESIDAAARRCGVSWGYLANILAWAGVRWRNIVCTPKHARNLRSYKYVDSFDVDEALAKWLATEVVAEAAHRRGLAPSTLRKWLREAGVEEVRYRSGPRSEWRVATETIDRVVADHDARETIAHAAKRLGVKVHWLGRKLAREGLEKRGPGREWGLTPDVYARVASKYRRSR